MQGYIVCYVLGFGKVMTVCNKLLVLVSQLNKPVVVKDRWTGLPLALLPRY